MESIMLEDGTNFGGVNLNWKFLAFLTLILNLIFEHRLRFRIGHSTWVGPMSSDRLE